MKHEKGVALLIVIAMILIFTIIASGVMLYSRSSTEASYREMRKTKAYYAAEAALQRALYAVYSGAADGTYPFQISVGGQWIGNPSVPDNQKIPLTYTITTNADGTKTVSASVANISRILLYFPEP